MENYWEANGHPPHPVKYEKQANKMKFGLFALVCLIGAVSATYDYKVGTVPMTVNQEFINLILRHPFQPIFIEEYRKYIETPVLDAERYVSVDVFKTKVVEFFKVYDMGMVLPRRRPYTVFDDHFLQQTGMLFNVFYYSKDLPTLFENIIWARENVNEMMFIHALTLTVFHRMDLTRIVLPPLYEIIPNHFFNYDVLQKGIDYKLNGLWKINSTLTLYTDYTSRFYLDKFQEQRVSYFTEDIGLNSFYYYFYMKYPVHLGGKDIISEKEPVGELWLWMHQQLLARYYLERTSNDLGSIPDFLWIKGIKNGYWPMLRYKNGVEFAYRSDYYSYESMDKDLLQNILDWELRIKQMIDHGLFTYGETTISIKDNDFVNKLGLILLGDVKETRFYRYLLVFYHMVAGGRGVVKQDPYFITPSVLEHFETCLRDPVFWQLYKRVIKYWLQYKDILPRYTVKDLYVPVKIENVIVSPLKTYFEYDEIDATNFVDIDLLETEQKFLFKLRQPRLNYEPFDVTVNVDVETAGEYTVRFFLGPKVLNRYELNDVRQYFFELDHFIYDFKSGKNTIIRKSREFLYFFKDLVKIGNGEYLSQYGFPMNLLLPKGKVGGMPFTFYVMIHKNDFKQQLGFPLDRKIDYYNFFVPNIDATTINFPYCGEPGLNFSTSGTNYSEDDADYTPGRRGKTSRQDPLSHRIIEKRRRDRMNSCLADLSRLIPPQYMRKGRGRVEKTEIIEMAIKHLRNLQNQECMKREAGCTEHYRNGYQDCLSEAAKFLMAENYSELCYRMVTRLKDVVRNEIIKGDCSKTRESIIPTGDASPRAPHTYEPQMSQLRDILTSASDIEHSSNDHLDVKDLSFRTGGSASQTVTTSSNPTPSIEINGNDYEIRGSYKATEALEADLRAMRMRKFSETSTNTADQEHNHNSYKFKNYIKQRFSQDNHLDDKVGSSSGSSTSSAEKSENLSKKRRADVSGDDHDDDKALHNGHSAESKIDFSTSSTTSSLSNGRHPIQSFCIPIFACHTQGYYIPLNVEYTALLPYLGEIDLLNKNCNQLAPLHPVNININYAPALSKNMATNFVKPKVENGW
uniref:CSON001608 protein n=1 Tax=Culicoides sonorensis TaxID=179676 RepID=A0A336KX33_CULSO